MCVLACLVQPSLLSMNITISLLQPEDLDQIVDVQSKIYSPDLHEEYSFYANRLQLAPSSCWKASDQQGRIQGYLISYPWRGDNPPALGHALQALPEAADQWFIHDCALLPSAQGKGWSKQLLRHGVQFARTRGLRWSSLVSLGQARDYWQAQGYSVVQAQAEQADHLLAYGPQSCMMRRAL